MSVIDEQQASIMIQPSGAGEIISPHQYNPANGHYEPKHKVSPASVVAVSAAAPGGPICLVPATVSQRWVYLVRVGGLQGNDVVTLVGTVGGAKLVVNVAAAVDTQIIEDIDSPIFTLVGGEILVAISAAATANPVSISYIDK
jgi:hypothetical protein